MMTTRISQTENEIVENFLRESFNYNGQNGANEGENSRSPAISMPTSRGDFENDNGDAALTEDIRKMARALAPQMSELKDLLKDFSEAETMASGSFL